MMRAMKSREVLLSNSLFQVARLTFEGPDGREIVRDVIEPGETPEACAAREVEEETGYRAGTIKPLTAFYASPGILDERMYGFIATDLTRSGQNLDADEEIEVFPIPQ